MRLATFFVFIFLFHLFLLNSADSKCQKSFDCGDIGTLEFPLFDYMQPKCMVDCNTSNPRIRLGDGERWYDIMYKLSKNKVMVKDPVLQVQLNEKNCSSLANLSLPNSPSSSFTVSPNLTLFRCSNHPYDREYTENCFENYLKYTGCGIYTVYYRNPDGSPTPESKIPRGCSVIQLPVKPNLDSHDLFDQLTAEFSVEWNVSHECYDCYYKGSQCGANSKNEFVCNAQGILLLRADYFPLDLVTPFVFCQKSRAGFK